MEFWFEESWGELIILIDCLKTVIVFDLFTALLTLVVHLTCIYFVLFIKLINFVGSIRQSYLLNVLIELFAFTEECFSVSRILLRYFSVPFNQVLYSKVNFLHDCGISLNFGSFALSFFGVIKDALRVSFYYRLFLNLSLTVFFRVVRDDIGCGSVATCIWKSRLLVLLSARADLSNLKSSSLLISLQSETALEVLVLKSATTRRVRYSIELDWLATCWTLNFFCEPSTKAYKMEDMIAA